MNNPPSPMSTSIDTDEDSILNSRFHVPGSIFPYVENQPRHRRAPVDFPITQKDFDRDVKSKSPSSISSIHLETPTTPPKVHSPEMHQSLTYADIERLTAMIPKPTAPPRLIDSVDDMPTLISREEMQAKLKSAYVDQLDNGLLDCLLVQDTSEFVFFDIQYTYLGDYLEISMAKVPVQVCLLGYDGNILYQANLAMFNPITGKQLVCMHDWVSLILEYLHSGTMSRRWYNEERVRQDIETMHGYFWSEDIPRRTLKEMRKDLSKLNLKRKILFAHDGNMRTYDLLKKICPENSLSPKLLALSSSKMIKMLLPDMPRDLYEFVTNLLGRDDLLSKSGPGLYKRVATQDATYVRQIFSFFLDNWRHFQEQPEIGRSLEDAPEMLVDVWEGFIPDSPLFEPMSESDDDEDQGISLEEVERLEKKLANCDLKKQNEKEGFEDNIEGNTPSGKE